MTTDPILFPCPCPWCKKIPNSGTRNDLYNGQGFVLCENWECPVNPEYTDTCLSLAIANWNRCADLTTKPVQPDPIVRELKEIIEEIKQALAALDAEENSVKQNNQSNEGG